MMLSPLFAFQERIQYIAVKEIKMLELETLLMLVNTVLYEYNNKCLKNEQSPMQKYCSKNC